MNIILLFTLVLIYSTIVFANNQLKISVKKPYSDKSYKVRIQCDIDRFGTRVELLGNITDQWSNLPVELNKNRMVNLCRTPMLVIHDYTKQINLDPNSNAFTKEFQINWNHGDRCT
ncbi:hypothetical protein niasHS_008843 [Heterodera schachtii]|uniref:Uncharacterized protein n=1 Tax=Heterodera schachtii TaxID=97005 RepID=A0ABD2IXK4_HETSC